MGILRYENWKSEQDAVEKLQASTGGLGKLFAFGNPHQPDYVVMAPVANGTWAVKYGGHPLTAVDFSEGDIEKAPNEEAAHAIAMEIADEGNCGLVEKDENPDFKGFTDYHEFFDEDGNLKSEPYTP